MEINEKSLTLANEKMLETYMQVETFLNDIKAMMKIAKMVNEDGEVRQVFMQTFSKEENDLEKFTNLVRTKNVDVNDMLLSQYLSNVSALLFSASLYKEGTETDFFSKLESPQLFDSPTFGWHNVKVSQFVEAKKRFKQHVDKCQ